MVVSALLAVGCSDSESEDPVPGPETGTAAISGLATTGDPGAPDSPYVWTPLPIGGGGWATGMVLHPTEPGRAYVRTDVSGAFRRQPDGSGWEQMLTVERIVPDGDAADEAESADYVIDSIAVAPSDPDRLYLSVGNDESDTEVGEGRGRVLRSDDGGTTWVPLPQRWVVAGNAAFRQRSEKLVVDPTDADRVLLGTRQEGLWRSTDAGATWQQVDSVPSGPAGDDGERVGVSFVEWGSGAHAATVWAGVEGSGVFVSTDGGETWSASDVEVAEGTAPFEGAYEDGRLYVTLNRLGGDGAGRVLVHTVDNGEWADITPDHESFEWSVAAAPDAPDRLVAVAHTTGGGMWRSTTGGDGWQRVDVDLRSDDVPWILEGGDAMYVGRLRFDPLEPDRLWFAEGRGVWIADDVFEGATIEWVATMPGLEQTVAGDLVVAEDGAPISAVADHQGFRHGDLGRYPGRQLVDSAFAGGAALDHAGLDRRDLVWIGAEYHRYYDPDRRGRGAVSRDGGQSWSELPNLTPDHFGGGVAVSAGGADNLVWVPSYIHPWEYDENDRGVLVTVDGGETWTRAEGLGDANRFHRLVWWFGRRPVAADRHEPGRFYLNDDEGRLWTSTDGGLDWTLSEHSPPCFEGTACHVFGQLRASPRAAGEVWASTGEGGLHRSNDAGTAEWESIEAVTEARSFDFGAPLDPEGPPTLYLWGRVDDAEQLGLWRSADDGESWELIGRHPGGLYEGITVVSGDPQRPGRVYLGTPGSGFVIGDDPRQEER